MSEAEQRASAPVAAVRDLKRLLPAALVGSALALVVFGWLSEQVLAGHTMRFDLGVRAAVHQHASPALTTAMRALSFFGSPLMLTSVVVVVIVIFLLLHWRHAAALLAITMGGAAFLDVLLKQVFHRTRPEPFFGAVPASYSFPSGHALASFCFFGVLAGLLSHRLRSRTGDTLIWLAAFVLVVAIGFSRIYLGVHYPTDVLGGYAAAAVWVGAIVAADRWRRRF